MAARDRTLGVVLAGGRSRRYGAHKSLATVGGIRLIERVLRPLAAVSARVGIVANEAEATLGVQLPVRPDDRPGLGALGGISTAVRWAAEEALDVALVVACDMPFVPEELLRELRSRASRKAACVPHSSGPRGLEPLCAAYGVGCLTAIEAALDRGDRSVISFFGDVDLRVLDAETVRAFGDPEISFLNINEPADLERAESWAGREP